MIASNAAPRESGVFVRGARLTAKPAAGERVLTVDL